MHPFTQKLLDWYALHARQLPWRTTDDAYVVWLSEVILQQTRVDQGWDYWQRFIRRWPTVDALAAATVDEVLKEWQGLGYYSRARHLHAAARQVVAAGGRFPTTERELKQLPGVGDYTAAAIASFAYGADTAAVDGNAYRVLGRYFAIDTPCTNGEGKRQYTELSNALLPKGRSADYNQALMDFGSQQCTPHAPRCTDCPLHDGCEARRRGQIAHYPVKERKTKVKDLRLDYVYIRCADGTIAIHQRGKNDIWQGLWEPPTAQDTHLIHTADGKPASDSRLTLLAEGVTHQLTHRRITSDFYLLECARRPTLPEGYCWIAETQRDDYAVPRLIEKLYQHVDRHTDA